MAQEPRPAGARPSRPLGRATSFPIAPPSEAHIARAAIIPLRPILRCRPARRMSGTVNGMRAAAGADPPMSAWLPITRASVMCVMSVSLSARGGELLVRSRKPLLRFEFGGPGSRGDMSDRRTQPVVVHGLAPRLLVFDLPNQLTLRITQRAGDVRVFGDRYQRRKAGQARAQYDALLLAPAVLQGDDHVHITRIPLA